MYSEAIDQPLVSKSLSQPAVLCCLLVQLGTKGADASVEHTGTTDSKPKLQMRRWNATISHTQQQTAAVVPFCTAITMQYNSYAIRSQSVLTTNSTGRVYNYCSGHSTYNERDSLLTQFL